MSINIRVTISGPKSNLNVLIGTIEKSFSSDRMTRDLLHVKNEVLSRLNTFINNHRKRNMEEHTERWRTKLRNNLYWAIAEGANIEQTRTNRFRLGIGKYDYLDKHAPYWYKVNAGGKIEMPTISVGDRNVKGVFGYFGRGIRPGAFGKDAFHGGSFQGKKFLMIPKRPIPPMYYLQNMVKNFRSEMNKLENQYKHDIKTRIRNEFFSKLSQKQMTTLNLSSLDLTSTSVTSMRKVLGM